MACVSSTSGKRISERRRPDHPIDLNKRDAQGQYCQFMLFDAIQRRLAEQPVQHPLRGKVVLKTGRGACEVIAEMHGRSR